MIAPVWFHKYLFVFMSSLFTLGYKIQEGRYIDNKEINGIYFKTYTCTYVYLADGVVLNELEVSFQMLVIAKRG